ncbi:MAG: T9SS C-terminal target domain-containing protein [Stygiobacter sp.]|nr:MAG: T9SS C-terminal target domain-containing protein [Stygiobacter sp.]
MEFSISNNGRYTLSIFNVLGELVEVISEKEYKAGYYKETFNAKELSSGIYLYRLNGDQTNLVRKMMLLR